MCVRVAGGGAGGGADGSAQPNTRTPHKDVGKNDGNAQSFTRCRKTWVNPAFGLKPITSTNKRSCCKFPVGGLIPFQPPRDFFAAFLPPIALR